MYFQNFYHQHQKMRIYFMYLICPSGLSIIKIFNKSVALNLLLISAR